MNADAILTVLACLGGWNFLNLVARVLCGASIAWRYLPSIFLGGWSALILHTGGA
jgi:hypothetical protein